MTILFHFEKPSSLRTETLPARATNISCYTRNRTSCFLAQAYNKYLLNRLFSSCKHLIIPKSSSDACLPPPHPNKATGWNHHPSWFCTARVTGPTNALSSSTDRIIEGSEGKGFTSSVQNAACKGFQKKKKAGLFVATHCSFVPPAVVAALLCLLKAALLYFLKASAESSKVRCQD